MSEVNGPDTLAVTGGRVVTPDGVRESTVLVEGGVIAAVRPPGEPVAAARSVDVRGCYVLPGLIDSHVHFRTPGLTEKEDWAHGSRAAVVGGITTVIDMPNTRPPTLTADDVEAKAELVAGSSLVDYGFHLGADPDAPDVLRRLDPAVAVSAKIFMAGHHTAPIVTRDPKQLEQLFAAAADGGVQLVLHAEDDNLFALLDAWQGDPQTYAEYEQHRPRAGAICAVSKVIELVRRWGTRAHVLHVSSADEVDLLVAAAAAGLPVTFEVTAHHLSFTAHDASRLGARIRLSPAIRDERDQRRLWQAVVRGEVTTLGSDHAPHTLEEKTRDVAAAPPGLPGVQELLPATWTGLRRRFPELSDDDAASLVARLLAAAPAELFRLAGKGRIAPGAAADLTVFDAGAGWMLSSRDVRSKCGWSAYEGWTMLGRVTMTVRAGRVVWDAESGTFGEPDGRWLAPTSRDRAPREVAGAVT